MNVRLLFSLITLFLAFFSYQLFAQPRMKIKEGTEINLGETREGTIVQKALTLQNNGKDTLIISEVKTSCGCTVAKTPKDKVAPGETTYLEIALNTTKFKGPVKKEIYVSTNDPFQPTRTIILNVKVRNDIEFEPNFLNFRTLTIGKESSASVKIKNTTNKAIQIISVTSPEPDITLKVSSKIIPSQKTITLTAKIKPTKTGRIVGQFELKTNHQLHPVMNLSFIGVVQ